jgi:prevent-host-death family protein
MHEAKMHFSKLVDSVMKGNEIVIVISGKPVARLSPIEKKPRRRPGALKGKIKIAKDFDDPFQELSI